MSYPAGLPGVRGPAPGTDVLPAYPAFGFGGRSATRRYPAVGRKIQVRSPGLPGGRPRLPGGATRRQRSPRAAVKIGKVVILV